MVVGTIVMWTSGRAKFWMMMSHSVLRAAGKRCFVQASAVVIIAKCVVLFGCTGQFCGSCTSIAAL